MLNQPDEETDILDIACLHCAIHEFMCQWIAHKAERNHEASGGMMVLALINNIEEQLANISDPLLLKDAAQQTLEQFTKALTRVLPPGAIELVVIPDNERKH